MKHTYIPMLSGKPIPVDADGVVKMQCCDCGLVHIYRITRKRHGYSLTAWRDNRCTSAQRRHGEWACREEEK